MLDRRMFDLMSLLQNEHYQTADFLAHQLKIGEKTVRNLIRELNVILEKNGAFIESKYGAGYRLMIKNSGQFESFLNRNQYRNSIPATAKERVSYLLEYLLTSKNFTKLEALSNLLFVSTKTLTTDLKEVRLILQQHNLRIISKPNYGIKVDGKEFDLRLCIANMIEAVNPKLINDTALFGDGKDVSVITDVVHDNLRKYNYTLSSQSSQNLVVHIYVAIIRIKEGCYVKMDEPKELENAEREYDIAKDIAKQINKEFNIDFPESEITYMVIHLAGKQTYHPDDFQKEGNLIISQEISDIVSEMIDCIYEAFQFDFRNDLELRISLSQHIFPLTIRIKHDMNTYNPMLKEIKEKYFLAYSMASLACTVLDRQYSKKIQEDEIGYIALLFALALERQRGEIKKRNILLICSSGKGSAQLLRFKFEREFSLYINTIEVCDVNSLYKVDFSNIDYVFSTVPIQTKIPVPVQEVRYFLNESDIISVKKALSTEGEESILKYYSEELFLPHIKCKSKGSVLSYMCHYVMKVKDLPEEFYETVLEREEMEYTTFGNRVAMPHPNKTLSKDTFVCVGILDEPIMWGEKEVQVIFLVSIENKKNKNLQKFYQLTSQFLLSQQCIQQLIDTRTYDAFIETIESLEENY